MLPDTQIIDNALPIEELTKWQKRIVKFKEHSNQNSAEAMHGDPLLVLAREIVGDLELIWAPIFAIRADQNELTELHRDTGEYAVIFYPFDCETGPLRTENGDVQVKANRLVAINVTTITHQQIVPTDESTRYSVAMKFRIA